jgi:hypothetical protein
MRRQLLALVLLVFTAIEGKALAQRPLRDRARNDAMPVR